MPNYWSSNFEGNWNEDYNNFLLNGLANLLLEVWLEIIEATWVLQDGVPSSLRHLRSSNSWSTVLLRNRSEDIVQSSCQQNHQIWHVRIIIYKVSSKILFILYGWNTVVSINGEKYCVREDIFTRVEENFWAPLDL